MDTSQVWAFFSYAWTQTCADEDACRFFVRQANIGMANLQQRISRWHARPYGWHLLNPLRLLGYPIALHLAWPYRAMLRRCVFAQTQN